MRSGTKFGDRVHKDPTLKETIVDQILMDCHGMSALCQNPIIASILTQQIFAGSFAIGTSRKSNDSAQGP